MEDFYGGGIPFSAMLDKKDKKDKKTKKRRNSRLTKRRKRSRTKVKKVKKSLKLNNCKCSLDKNSPSPEGLGFCAVCSPLNIMMKGRNGELWEITSKKGKAHFWKLIN